MASLSPTELYLHEAERLRALAESPAMKDIRDAYLEIADRYEELARRNEGYMSREGRQPIPFHGHWNRSS